MALKANCYINNNEWNCNCTEGWGGKYCKTKGCDKIKKCNPNGNIL